MRTKANFTVDDWEEVKSNWSSWWNEEIERPMVILERLVPKEGMSFPEGINSPVFNDFDDSPLQFPLDMDVEKVIDHYEDRLNCTRYYGDAFPKFWPNFGPGIVSGFIGADVHYSKKESTIWYDLPEKLSIVEFNPVFDPNNTYWKRVCEITEAGIMRWGKSVALAHTDLGGNLDILSSVIDSQELFMEMLLNPSVLAEKIGQLTDTWLQYFNALDRIIQRQEIGTSPWAGIFSTKRCYMLQSDLSVMIDSSLFEQFVLPDIKKCCDYLDHSFYHLDGKEQIQHLDMLLSVENLHGIQWIPGAGNPPPEEWMDLLKRIRDAGKLCQLYVTPEGARKIVDELGGKGFAFYIWKDTTHDEAEKLVSDLGGAS